jgi:hypothetical protein
MGSADVAHTVTHIRNVDKRKIYRMYFSVRKITVTKKSEESSNMTANLL